MSDPVPTPKHLVLLVRLDHLVEGEPLARRIERAAETFGVSYAWIEDGPLPDGTYAVHAPLTSTLPTLRTMIAHEGMTIVGEDECPGSGLYREVRRS
jgi:hypothetical protein